MTLLPGSRAPDPIDIEPIDAGEITEYLSLYLRLGFSVVPAVYGDKRPEVPWEPYQRRRPTNAEVARWFLDGKDHNIAVVCGAVSGNLVVLDFDDVGIYEKFFDPKKIEAETIVVRTGGGKRHVYIRSTEPVPSFKVPQVRLEVRSDGNIVIAPPSLHPSGKRYEFASGVRRVLEVDDALEGVLETLKEKFGIEPFQIADERLERFEAAGPGYRGRAPPCILRLLRGVGEGFRNEAAARLASYYLHTKGYTVRRTWGRLLEWNKRNTPPLEEGELRTVLRSMARKGYTYACRSLSPFCDREHCGPFLEWRKKRLAERSVARLLEEDGE